jgi:hypothetical protein
MSSNSDKEEDSSQQPPAPAAFLQHALLFGGGQQQVLAAAAAIAAAAEKEDATSSSSIDVDGNVIDSVVEMTTNGNHNNKDGDDDVMIVENPNRLQQQQRSAKKKVLQDDDDDDVVMMIEPSTTTTTTADDIKHRKLEKLCRGGYPSFVKLLLANYETEDDEEQQLDDDDDGVDFLMSRQQTSPSSSPEKQKGTATTTGTLKPYYTINVDVMLGLKTKEQLLEERRFEEPSITRRHRNTRASTLLPAAIRSMSAGGILFAKNATTGSGNTYNEDDSGYYFQGSRLLALPEDSQYLSELHCWIRNQLEFFSATSQEAAQRQSVVVNKVGIRCIHCAAAVAKRQKEKEATSTALSSYAPPPHGAVSYPANLAAIFTICQAKPQAHFENNCPNLPQTERMTLNHLLREYANMAKRQRRELSSATYYLISAKRIGLVEESVVFSGGNNNNKSNGIRFGRDLQLGPLSFEMCHKQVVAEPMNNDEANGSATYTGGSVGGGAGGNVTAAAPKLIAAPEAEAVLAEALLQPDVAAENPSRASDKDKVTDFFFLLLRQMQICHVLPMDFNTKGKKMRAMRLGLAGFACRYCNEHEPYTACRSFASAPDNMNSSVSHTFAGHLLKCPRVPETLKMALQAYKKLHARQLAQLPYGSQRRLIQEVWERLRAEDLSEEEMKLRIESLPAAMRMPEPAPSSISSSFPMDVASDEAIVQYTGTVQARKQQPRFNEATDMDVTGYPDSFPRCIDEQTQAILEANAQNWDSDPSTENLILPSERYIVSEYVFLALRQLVAAQPYLDSRARRVAGLQCRYCMDQPQMVTPAGRVFPSAPDNYASALNASLKQHFQNCVYIPAELKEALANVRKLHSNQCSSLPFGAQRRFFNILFDRLSQLTVVEQSPGRQGYHRQAGANGNNTNLLIMGDFLQVGSMSVCGRCRMVPIQFRTSNSIFMKQPTAVQMQTHECKEDAFDLSIVEHELRQAVETELGGQLEILSSDAFRNLINVCVCGQPELLALFIDMALSLQSATHQQVVNYSSSGLWSKFPQAVDYAHVAAAFDALNTEGKPENLTNCPHFLRFIMLITPAMQLPERNDVGDEKQTEPVDVNDEMVVA